MKDLSKVERLEIAILLEKEYSMRAIAKVLGRSPNTISYEVKRNSVHGRYDPLVSVEDLAGKLAIMVGQPHMLGIIGPADKYLLVLHSRQQLAEIDAEFQVAVEAKQLVTVPWNPE